MSRKPKKYEKNCIYCIGCKDDSTQDIYIGHTTNFGSRKREHKSRTYNNFPFLVYRTINANGGWDNWEMFKIETYPCKNVKEAKEREQYWCDRLHPALNDKSPILDD